MSTDTDTGDDGGRPPEEIHLSVAEDGDCWVARDEETGVASQGPTRAAALSNLDEAVALYHGEVGREPTDAERRAVGVDPDAERSDELPDILE